MELGGTTAHPSASDASSPTSQCTSQSSKKTQLMGPSGKVLVELWPNGQIVGPNASKFKTAIGNQVRLNIPINTRDWRLVDDSFKDAIWKALTEEFEFNVENFEARPLVETNYSQKLRTQKATFRSKILEKAENIEAAKANCPPAINPALWEDFVDYELQPEVKQRNAKNASNRAMNTIGGTNGRITFSQIHDELQQQNPQAKITRVDDWLKGRERRDGSVLKSAREKYDQVKTVKKRRLDCGETDTGDINSDALTEVLGKDKKNCVRGVGSNITRKQLQHAAVASALLNQMAATSVAKVEADVATFKSKVETDMCEVKSMLKVLIQQQPGNTMAGNNVTTNAEAHMSVTTPRTEVGSSSAQRQATPQNATSVAKVEADVATFKSKVEADMCEVKSMLKVLIQQQLGNTVAGNNVTTNAEAHVSVTTPRTEIGSSSAQRQATPRNLTPAFGSLEQPRVTLLDKFGTEVAKGSIDVSAKICHGRILVGGERRVYIDEVLVPDAAVYDSPQDGNVTLNAWLEGGYIAWLDGRLKYD